MKWKLFIYAISAVRKNEVGGYQFSNTCGACVAHNEEEAYDYAMDEAMVSFRESQGYHSHTVNVLDTTELFRNWFETYKL